MSNLHSLDQLLFISYKELKGCITLLFRSHGTYLNYVLLTMYVNNHFKVVTVFLWNSGNNRVICPSFPPKSSVLTLPPSSAWRTLAFISYTSVDQSYKVTDTRIWQCSPYELSNDDNLHFSTLDLSINLCTWSLIADFTQVRSALVSMTL